MQFATWYTVSREFVLKHTNGVTDMYYTPEAAAGMLFPLEAQMKNGVMALFGDDNLAFYFPVLIQYLQSNYLGTPFTVSTSDLNSFSSVDWGWDNACLIQVLAWFPTIKTPNLPGISSSGTNTLRKYFTAAGVLVSRPDSVSDGTGIALTAKALGNGGHGHLDCGTYAIALNGVYLSGDPGRHHHTSV